MSEGGGFAQLTTFTEHKQIAFCVADTGQGIMTSLREAMPQLQYDRDAIAEAVRAGVTRNKDIGQGNGLSGTLKIAQEAAGQMTITSGSHTTTWTRRDVIQKESISTEAP
jgi:sensor histidine kinase regulating citrate/malate metabolism